MSLRRPSAPAPVGLPVLWFALAAGLFWVLESIVDAIAFSGGTVLKRLWPNDSHDIWMRIEVVLPIGVVVAAMSVASVARTRAGRIAGRG